MFLDLTHLPPEQLDAKLPDVTEFIRTYQGIEPKTAAGAHPAHRPLRHGRHPHQHRRRGRRRRPRARSSTGLYAAGECACVSVHGANRLGTNSLLDIVVFGKRGGAAMAAYVATAEMPEPVVGCRRRRPVPDRQVLGATGGEKVADLRTRLQEEMQSKASVFRTGREPAVVPRDDPRAAAALREDRTSTTRARSSTTT